MPAKFDRMVDSILKGMRGKKNPRTGKSFTRSDAFAVATATWKKSHGGKAPSREAVEDWKILEFIMPIKEVKMVGDDFLVTGVCINETTTRNGIKYTVDELEHAAESFREKPILLDHENKVQNIVGRTTKNVSFSHEKRGIEFEARIVDEDIQRKINQGLITDVSIGASVKDLIEEDDGSRKAVGLEGMEISFVAVPGDPNANLAQAMENSFMIRESLDEGDRMLDEILNKLKGGIEEMGEEEEQKQEEQTEEKPKVEEPVAGEGEVHKTEINVDMSAVTEAIKSLKEEIVALKKVKEEEPAVEEPKVEDKTKGEVAPEEPEADAETTESMVLEQAESGKGFAIWRDYSKDNSGKLKRLIR